MNDKRKTKWPNHLIFLLKRFNNDYKKKYKIQKYSMRQRTLSLHYLLHYEWMDPLYPDKFQTSIHISFISYANKKK